MAPILSRFSNIGGGGNGGFGIGRRKIIRGTGNAFRGLIGNGTARTDALAANLQLAYPFSDAANGTDYSGNNRNLSATGSPTEYAISGVDINGDAAPYTTSYGKTASGANNTWTLPSSTYNFKSGNITVECWFYFSSLDSALPFVNYYSSQSEGGFAVDGNNSIYSNAYQGYIVQTANNIVTRNSWNHVAYTRDTSTAPDTHRIYVNGTLQATATSDNYGGGYTTNQFGAARFGGDGGVGNFSPNSFIMDFRVYNTVKYTSNFDIRNYLPILNA